MNGRKGVTLQNVIAVLALFDLKNFSHTTIMQINNIFQKVVLFVKVTELNTLFLKSSCIFNFSATEQTTLFYDLYLEKKWITPPSKKIADNDQRDKLAIKF